MNKDILSQVIGLTGTISNSLANAFNVDPAKIADSLGYNYFCTTLTLSPHKNCNWINEIGEKLDNKYNSTYLYSDFKKKNGYKRSIELSKIYNLYRQDYCGCIYSKVERDNL